MPKTSVPTILAVNEGYLWLIDFEGKAVAQFNAPLSEFPNVVQHTPFGEFGTKVYRSKGVWVRLVKDQSEYLAVVASFISLERSLLYIYEPSGKLVYQEVLPEESSSIAVLPAETPDGVSALLVGGSGTVWRYTAK